MAALSSYLVNQNLEPSRPKIVPKPKTSQGVGLLWEGVQGIKIRIGPEARPKRILLGTINDCHFRVIKAIPVHLEVRGGTVIASWRAIDEFGTGRSSSLACDDLGRTVSELYRTLKAEESRLGPDLARVWDILRRHIASRV
jgi:hypothetical protein